MTAVSTWSLHRTLGAFHSGSAPDGGTSVTDTDRPGLALLELPAALHEHGYDTVQICHFHLPRTDPGYLDELRGALAAGEITLDALLVDDGDLTDPDVADNHERWIGGWLDIAATLGARRARVIAGKQTPTPDRLAASATRLRRLAEQHPDVRLVTENWMALLPDADSVETLLQQAGEKVGLLIDLGNWTGTDKYEELARIAPLAETCHAKCHSEPVAETDSTTGLTVSLDTDDYRRSLRVLTDAGFDGPLALVYDGADDQEWSALDALNTIASAGRTAA